MQHSLFRSLSLVQPYMSKNKTVRRDYLTKVKEKPSANAISDMFRNQLGGCFLGNLLDRPVQVVHMDVQQGGEIRSRPELHPLMRFVNGELAFKELQEQRGDPLGSIDPGPVHPLVRIYGTLKVGIQCTD